MSFTFVMKSYHFIRKKIQEQQERRNNLNQNSSFGREGCGLPSFLRLYKWNHMEIYFISLCIGVWQLGSIISYLIHLYCSILTGIFDVLVSIGIVEPSDAQCNRIQASLAGNVFIMIGSFLILLAVFFLQVSGQYKRNIAYASKYVDDEDIPTLSLAWSQDESKNRRYSYLSESFSAIDTDARSSITNLTNSSLRHTRVSFRDSRSKSPCIAQSGPNITSIQLSPTHETFVESSDEDELSVRIASPISNVALRSTDRSGATKATCEYFDTSNKCID